MAGDLYAEDFIAWTEQQARRLREVAVRGTNLGLDWDHLAEEVEDLGRNHRRATASQLLHIIEHLLKLEFSPAVAPRAGWIDSVLDARGEIELLLDDDPGLRPRLPEVLDRMKPLATRRAAAALAGHGEDEAAAAVRQAGADHYAPDQILGDWFPARPDLPPPRRA